MKYFLKAMQIMAVVSQWCEQALMDGVVTIDELVTLGKGVCDILGVELKLDLRGE